MPEAKPARAGLSVVGDHEQPSRIGDPSHGRYAKPSRGSGRRVTGTTIQEHFESRVRAPYGLDFYLGLPEEAESRFLTTLPLRPTAEQQAELVATASGAHSLSGIAFNRNNPRAIELPELPNVRAVRAKAPASAGGVGSARGLAGMYAAAISELDGRAPLLKPWWGAGERPPGPCRARGGDGRPLTRAAGDAARAPRTAPDRGPTTKPRPFPGPGEALGRPGLAVGRVTPTGRCE